MILDVTLAHTHPIDKFLDVTLAHTDSSQTCSLKCQDRTVIVFRNDKDLHKVEKVNLTKEN